FATGGSTPRLTDPTSTAEAHTASLISGRTRAQLQAAVTALAPAVMAAGLLHHPHIGTPLDPEFLARVATTVATDPDRWALSHLTAAVGSALLILAFLAVRSRLRAAGEERWSVLALPFAVMGSALYALV